MGNPYFDPGADRASKVKDLFARIAPRYDLLNDLQSFGLHRWWKRRVIQLAQPRPGERALDLCCGTGDLALALAAARVRSVGLDFTEQMLERAHRKARSDSQAELARFVRGDAQHLPFPERSFDILTIGYGLRNLADWKSGLGETLRVLRPGGRLLVLDFGKPDNPLWRGIYFTYLRLFVPVLGLLFAGSASAYAYILESLKHYPAQHGVASAMRELGFTDVRICFFLGGVMTINYGRKAAS